MRFYDVTSWSYVNLDDPLTEMALYRYLSLENLALCGTVTSTPATGTDGQPQLIQRIMKALGMVNLIPLLLF